MITKYKKYPLDNSRFMYIPTKQSDQVVHRILKTPKYKKEDAIFKSVRLSAANNQVSDFNLDEVIAKNQLKDKITKVLSSLTPREERVIRMRFAIGLNTDYTLEEIGQQFSVTRDRIRQIEAKALRKLKHPTRSGELKDFFEVA